jgi:hypothetical protein
VYVKFGHSIFRLQLTFCRFAMGGLFSTNVHSEHCTFGYHKIVCGARNPAYCKCAVEPTSYGRELNIPKNNIFLWIHFIKSIVWIQKKWISQNHLKSRSSALAYWDEQLHECEELFSSKYWKLCARDAFVVFTL